MARTTIFKFNSEEDRARAALATVTYRRRGHAMLTGSRTITLRRDDILPAFRDAITARSARATSWRPHIRNKQKKRKAMAEITIRWQKNTPDGESRWDGMADAVAEAVADLLESFEQAETEGLPGQETEYFIAETHRLANSVTLAYRARRGKR